MEYYELYLQSASMYALGYWIVLALSVVVPLVVFRLTMRWGKFGTDGLLDNASAVMGLSAFIVTVLFGVVFSVISLTNAIPATFAPAIWALSRVTGCE